MTQPAPRTRRRTQPLRAQTSASVQAPAPAPPAPEDVAALPVPTADARKEEADRHRRLSDGVRKLRVGGGTLNFSERTLMIIGSILAVIGLVAIFIGWYGASHSPFLFQQIPYLISGGLFGLGLVFLGSIFYFSHWLTELVKEGRTQSAALVEAISRLEDTIKQQSGQDRFAITEAIHSSDGHASDGRANGASSADLVSTSKGTMAHSPDCVVVAGKHGLRPVSRDDGLEPCKLCDPYSEAASN